MIVGVVHVDPPTFTEAPVRNPVPLIVMVVPPEGDPPEGLTDVMVGIGL